MITRKAARVAALLVGGSALLAATPGLAQTPAQRQAREAQQRARSAPAQPAQAMTPQQQVAQRRFSSMSRREQAALNPLLVANVAANQARSTGQTPNWAPVQAALPAAQAAAKSNEAKFFLAQVQLDMALGANNIAAQEQALTALLGNPVVTPEEQTVYRGVQNRIINKRAEQAFTANDFATAERLFKQLLQTNPNDERLIANLRIVQERMGNSAGAAQTLDQQIRAAEAAGQRASEDLYQRAWQIPYRAGQRGAAVAGLQRLLRNYPTPVNWRTAVDFVREGARQDDQLLLDTYRFARAANVVQANEYVGLAQMLEQSGLPGETKAFIDAGVAAGSVRTSQGDVARMLGIANRRIAEDRAGLPGQIRQARSAANGRQARIAGDVLYGYGRYGEAAEMYRLALSKGGENASMLNTRIGASLAMAGQRAEAETALRGVTGTWSELAGLWLAWLDRRQG